MIALKEQMRRAEIEMRELDDYESGYVDGWLAGSGIAEREAFFEIGLAIFSLVVGVFFGWAVSGL